MMTEATTTTVKAQSMPAPAKSTSPPPKSASQGGKMHRRSRSGMSQHRSLSLAPLMIIGCFTCRLRRKKCDEGKPKCKACRHLGLTCEYKRPMWWSNNEQRRKQKEDIKTIIKRTKLTEKQPSMSNSCMRPPLSGRTYSSLTCDSFSDNLGRGTRGSSMDSDDSYGYDFSRTNSIAPGMYDYSHQIHPQYFTGHMTQSPYPFEVDIKTERQYFVNDVPTRRDSSISTFSTFHPPPAHATLPSLPLEEYWVQQDYQETRRDSWSGEEGLDFNFFDFSHGPVAPVSSSATIPVEECDRPLLDHFLDNVLRLIFPILEVNQHGSVKSEVILPALETNKCYLHCCLSIAAIHLKATQGLGTEAIDNDIMRHRFETVSELCQALTRDTDHVQILEATLGMIFFQCSVGRADDCLPDIPWHQHFQAANELVQKLELPRQLEEMPLTSAHPPFNMTLTAWIDILGSTMLGRVPQFAHTYRTKHIAGSSSGLCELMGCEDRVMYLLSEIACLDALRVEGKVDDIAVCGHIAALARQIDATEETSPSLATPLSSTGAVRPRQLSKNMTAIYRLAARIYLCSLVPDFSRYNPAITSLIAQFAELMHYIPAGPDGFDRSLVWPLLICGSFSIPTSPFREIFTERCKSLGQHADFGSFGRMVRLVQEVWRRADDVQNTQAACEPTPISATGQADFSIPIPEPKKQNVHWRDVMQQNGWDFLLI